METKLQPIKPVSLEGKNIFPEDENEFSEDVPGSAPESEPGCVEKMKKMVGRVIPYGGYGSSVFNLASVCVGGGILGLPAAASSSGLVMALLYLAIISCFSIFSFHILAVTMEKTGLRTFETMGKTLMGRGFDYFVAAIRWMNSFGTAVAYIISVGDVWEPILKNASGMPEFLKTTAGRRVVTTLTWLVLMVPLILPKRVNSLRYVSTVAVIFVIYFVIMVIIHSCMTVFGSDSGGISEVDIKLFNTGNSAIEGLGVFMFAYLCQVNCFEVYWELRDRTSRNFTVYSATAMVLICVLYVLTVIFGYLEFGDAVQSSILLMYDPIAEPMVMAGYVGILIKLCASFALQSMALRNSIYHVIKWDLDTLAYWKHIIFVVVLSTAVLLFGLFIPNIKTVFGFVGGICGGFLSFMFPALFFMYSGQWTMGKVGAFHFFGTYALLFAGVVGIVFGTCSAIYGVFP